MSNVKRIVDKATGESVVLGEGDGVIFGAVRGDVQEVEVVRAPASAEQAEMAVYDALETLRGRCEVSLLSDGPKGNLRAGRLRTAAQNVTNAVEALARKVEGK